MTFAVSEILARKSRLDAHKTHLMNRVTECRADDKNLILLYSSRPQLTGLYCCRVTFKLVDWTRCFMIDASTLNTDSV